MVQIPDAWAPWSNGVTPNQAAANGHFHTPARQSATLSPQLLLSPPPASPTQKCPGAKGLYASGPLMSASHSSQQTKLRSGDGNTKVTRKQVGERGAEVVWWAPPPSSFHTAGVNFAGKWSPSSRTALTWPGEAAAWQPGHVVGSGRGAGQRCDFSPSSTAEGKWFLFLVPGESI